MDPVRPELLTTADLAKVLGVSERHVFTLEKEGHVPAPVRLGGSKRWTRIAVDQWLAAGCPKRKTGKTS